MDLIIAILPVVTKDIPISPRFTPSDFLSRCKFSNFTTREFYLLTFPRFPLRKKEHKSYSGMNRTHDFRTSRCAGYQLDHSGDNIGNTQKSRGRKAILILQNIRWKYHGCILTKQHCTAHTIWPAYRGQYVFLGISLVNSGAIRY